MPRKPTTPAQDDPFADLDTLRISQDFLQSSGVEKLLLKVPVRKPNRQEFFRIKPGEDYRLDTVMVELSEDREWYLPAPAAREAVLEEAKPVRLFTGITRQGVVFLWPARLPDADGRVNHWHSSALEAAELAETSWVRMAASRPAGRSVPTRSTAPSATSPSPLGPIGRSPICCGSRSPTAT